MTLSKNAIRRALLLSILVPSIAVSSVLTLYGQAPAVQNNAAQNTTQVPLNAQQQLMQQQAAAQQLLNPPPPQAPFAPLPQDHQKYLDQVLDLWSKNTAAIQRYQCDFIRWTYEGQESHARYAKGILKFQSPDKGLFKVEDLYFDKGATAQPRYEKVAGQFGEWWLCDGKNVHSFDRTNETVDIFELPPEMQGVEVYNSPLPFLFGVDPQKINARYWIRPIAPPKDANGNPQQNLIALEAFPKMMADAQNYSRVIIYLDAKEFLPISLHQFMPNWTPESKQLEVFEFANREVNFNLIGRIAQIFQQAFIPFDAPKGWTVKKHPYNPPADGDRMALPPGADNNKR